MTALYVSKADADKNTAEFQRMKKIADKLDAPLIHVTEADYTLTRAQARNRATYEKARDMARGVGAQVRILADTQPDTPTNSPLAAKTHLKTEDTVYATAAAMRDRQTFLRLEAEAKREHKQFRPIRSWEDLPAAERDQLEASLKDA